MKTALAAFDESVPKRLIRLHFSARQWALLQNEPLFRAATQAVRTICDAQNVSRLGDKLISRAALQRAQGK
jgi:hypothetical protein